MAKKKTKNKKPNLRLVKPKLESASVRAIRYKFQCAALTGILQNPTTISMAPVAIGKQACIHAENMMRLRDIDVASMFPKK